MKKTLIYLTFLLAVVAACKKPFNPTLTSTVTNYLAVDGTIVSGDSTFITLSRTTALSDTTQNKVELKAVLSVEDDKGTMYAFTEKGKGVYTLGVTNFSAARQYRLDIKTTDGKVYRSDFVPMKVTPAIDSVYFKQNSDKTVLFYVNSHDATNGTRYYRWDYKETWSYVSLYQAMLQYKNGQITPIAPNTPDAVNVCFRTDLSNQIFIGSSAKLTQDVISNQLLGGLAANSEKLGHAYVMQLKQYALTAAGYDYYQNLQANTEQLGSIFDAQPSTVKGNIHCITSPSDLVVGFVSVSTATTKQFNLHANDIPLRVNDPYGTVQWQVGQFYSTYYFTPPDTSDCHYGSIDTSPYSTFAARFTQKFAKADSVLIDRISTYIEIDAPGPNFLEPTRSYRVGYVYAYAPKNCVDCRLKGGTNIKPSYFPAQTY